MVGTVIKLFVFVARRMQLEPSHFIFLHNLHLLTRV